MNEDWTGWLMFKLVIGAMIGSFIIAVIMEDDVPIKLEWGILLFNLVWGYISILLIKEKYSLKKRNSSQKSMREYY